MGTPRDDWTAPSERQCHWQLGRTCAQELARRLPIRRRIRPECRPLRSMVATAAAVARELPANRRLPMPRLASDRAHRLAALVQRLNLTALVLSEMVIAKGYSCPPYPGIAPRRLFLHLPLADCSTHHLVVLHLGVKSAACQPSSMIPFSCGGSGHLI